MPKAKTWTVPEMKVAAMEYAKRVMGIVPFGLDGLDDTQHTIALGLIVQQLVHAWAAGFQAAANSAAKIKR